MTFHRELEVSEDTVTAVRQTLEAAVKKLQRSAAGRDTLARMFGEDWKAAIDGLDWEGWSKVLDAMADKLMDTRTAEAEDEMRHVLDQLGIEWPKGISLGGPYVAAADRAAAGAAEKVTAITENTREAIRAWIERAQLDGMSVPDLAANLREIVGLSERDAIAVANYRKSLEDAGEQSKSRINDLVGTYSDRCIDRRCTTIARTELQETSYEARADAWDDAVAAGVIPKDAQKVWQVNQGCDICDENDGESVSLDDVFPSGDDMPPAHPNCKCTVFLDGDTLGDE